MKRRRLSRLLAVVGLVVATAPAVHAQTWTADLYAGGTRYDALADRVSTTNLIGTLRYQARRDALGYIALAAPLAGEAALWGASGVNLRLLRHTLSGFNYGIDVGADGYLYRDPGASALHGGAAGHALPLIALARAAGTIELRGGWQQHAFSYADTSGSRGLLELGSRVQTSVGVVAAQLDARWLRASEADYPFVGVQLATSTAPARFWASTGRWFADSLDDVVWSAGASLDIARAGEVWLSVRHDGGDPLYQSGARRAWNIGFSRQLGGRRPPSPVLTPRITPGAVQLRLPLAAVPGNNDAAPLVAGEFNEWKPTPMQRENGRWVLDLPLAAGVYRFSFVSASGEWFVPENYPGRMNDGMGGHVAILVVP